MVNGVGREMDDGLHSCRSTDALTLGRSRLEESVDTAYGELGKWEYLLINFFTLSFPTIISCSSFSFPFLASNLRGFLSFRTSFPPPLRVPGSLRKPPHPPHSTAAHLT